MPNIVDRIKNGWSAFMNRSPTNYYSTGGSYIRPDRFRFTRGNDRSIVTSIYNRFAIDASSINIVHAKVDENGGYLETISSNLNKCLSLSANLDQTSKCFIQDCIMSMLDEGCIAIVPVDTDVNPKYTSSYDILSLRVGKIIEWFPKEVKVSLYNENTGKREEVIVSKSYTAIVENPLYAIVNEPNSTLQRLIRKLSLLDYIDEQTGSGKLNLIIQLPYSIRTTSKEKLAESRKASIESQLTDSKYGIAYMDSTEKVIQLNRSVENNLLAQIEKLWEIAYAQLGITVEVLNGTADEKTMNNYYNRTIIPLMIAIADEMKRKWISTTALTQGQSICLFRDPFKLVPVTDLAELGDKMTRNEIMSSNELRQAMGMKRSEDPRADELRNANIADNNMYQPYTYGEETYDEENQNGDEFNNIISDLENQIGGV